MCQKIFHLHNELLVSSCSISRSLDADLLINTRSIDRSIDSIRTNSISENENERDFRLAFFDMIDRRVTPVHTIDRRRCASLCVSPGRSSFLLISETLLLLTRHLFGHQLDEPTEITHSQLSSRSRFLNSIRSDCDACGNRTSANRIRFSLCLSLNCSDQSVDDEDT